LGWALCELREVKQEERKGNENENGNEEKKEEESMPNLEKREEEGSGGKRKRILLPWELFVHIMKIVGHSLLCQTCSEEMGATANGSNERAL